MFWSLYATTSYSENPQILLNSYIQQAGLEELYTWHPGEAKEVISMVERSNLYGEKLSRDDLSLLDTPCPELTLYHTEAVAPRNSIKFTPANLLLNIWGKHSIDRQQVRSYKMIYLPCLG